MEFYYKAAMDGGNSEQGAIIGNFTNKEEGPVEGEMFLQPSAISKIKSNPFYEDQNLETAVKNIFNQLVVNIDSTSVEPGMYLVGKNALESSEFYTNIAIGHEEKRNSDVPVVMALSILAGKAVQDAYKIDPAHLKETLKLNVDMDTGLPLTEYDQEIGNQFGSRFMGDTHNVRVWLGKNVTVKVEIKFEYVKVFPEAVPVVFSLLEDLKGKVRKGKIFEEFAKTYNLGDIDGNYFADKRLLHNDIGEGTTEFPITDGLEPNQKFKKGTNNGIGHALENSLEDYAKKINVLSVQRHNISSVLKTGNTPKNKYYKVAYEVIQESLDKQAQEILRVDCKQMDNVKNELDIVVIYGGGSILMKKHLYPELKKECDKRQIKVFYVPEEFASTLYLEGLYNILNNGIFDLLKKQALISESK